MQLHLHLYWFLLVFIGRSREYTIAYTIGNNGPFPGRCDRFIRKHFCRSNSIKTIHQIKLFSLSSSKMSYTKSAWRIYCMHTVCIIIYGIFAYWVELIISCRWKLILYKCNLEFHSGPVYRQVHDSNPMIFLENNHVSFRCKYKYLLWLGIKLHHDNSSLSEWNVAQFWIQSLNNFVTNLLFKVNWG